MRGHWESTTRKLNKHYQSSKKQGGVFPPVDPFKLTFGEFYTGGLRNIPTFSIPESGESPVYPSGHGEIYSIMYGAKNGPSTFNGTDGDFAAINHWEGLRNIEHSIFVSPISNDNYEGYNDPSDTQRYTIYQEAQRLYTEGTAARRLDTASYPGIIWRDYRERYVKFTFPERFYSPAYRKDEIEVTGSPSYYAIAEQQFPYDTKFELSARSCKAGTFPSANTTLHYLQNVVLSQYNSSNTRILRKSFNIGYSDVVNVYDKELNGESYIDITIDNPDRTFYYNDGYYQYRQDCQRVRIYCFIHDNSYYVEQVAHIYDSNGDEITDIVVNIESLKYPNPLYPYFLNPAFVQPQGSYRTYPSPEGPSRSLSDGTFNRVGFTWNTSNYYSPLVEDFYVLNSSGAIAFKVYYSLFSSYYNSMMVQFLTAQEFWNKHDEWCNEHGGTPYVPPVVTP